MDQDRCSVRLALLEEELNTYRERVLATEREGALRYARMLDSFPVAIVEADLSEMRPWFETLRSQKVEDLKSLIMTDDQILEETLSRISISYVNNACLQLLRVESRDHLKLWIVKVFRDRSRESFSSMINGIWEGRRDIVHAGVGEKTSGEKYDYILRLTIAVDNGYLKYDQVFISITDITDTIKEYKQIRKEVTNIKRALDASGLGYWDWNISSGAFDADEKALGDLGYEPGELENSHDVWIGFVHPEDIHNVQEYVAECIKGDADSLDSIFRGRHKDGTWRRIHCCSKMIRDQKGQVVRIVGTNRVITEEYEQGKQEVYHSSVLDILPTGVIYRDRNYKVLMANQAAQRITGYGLETIRNMRYPEDWPAINRDGTQCSLEERPAYQALKSGGEVMGRTLGVLDEDGHIMSWVCVNSVPIFRDGESQPHQVFSTIDDVTKQVWAEEELKRSNSEKQAILNCIPDIIISVDKNLKLLNYNRDITAVCPMAKRAVKEKYLDKIMTAKDCPCLDVLRQTLESRQPVASGRVKCSCDKNATRFLELSGSPLVHDNDDFMGAVLVLRDITRLENLEQELRSRRARMSMGGIVGRSLAMQKIYGLIDQLSDLETTVLINGESGTGKELVAEALHFEGTRAKAPLVKVNCSALSENLLESELFGHVRGAFSGAVRDKVGRFEAAEGGTLFLDEIGDISSLIQLKLLRVLETKEFERVGDSETRAANVRILVATNVDLRDAVRQGRFREDLYYRLKVVSMELPPLRARKEDIPLLSEHFVHLFSRRQSKKITGIETEVMNLLMRHNWPGNVRELRHTLEHGTIMCRGGKIRMEHLPVDILSGNSEKVSQASILGSQSISSHDIEYALRQVNMKKAKAARLLGISRSTLYRKMEEFGMTTKKKN